FAHHLDASDNRGVVFFRHGLHGRLQHAVDAVFHHYGVALGFNVNIAGALLQSGEDGGVHQADNGADIGLRGNAVDGDVFVVSGFFIADYIQHKAFAGLFQHPLRLLCFFQDFIDLRESRDPGLDPSLEQQADLVDHHQLAGIGNGDPEYRVILLQWNEVVAEHQVDRDGFKKFGIQVVIAQVDKLTTIARGHVPGALLGSVGLSVRSYVRIRRDLVPLIHDFLTIY